jgi:hypothetical protein
MSCVYSSPDRNPAFADVKAFQVRRGAHECGRWGAVTTQRKVPRLSAALQRWRSGGASTLDAFALLLKSCVCLAYTCTLSPSRLSRHVPESRPTPGARATFAAPLHTTTGHGAVPRDGELPDPARRPRGPRLRSGGAGRRLQQPGAQEGAGRVRPQGGRWGECVECGVEWTRFVLLPKAA